jgi:hypothetical protein
MGGCLSPGRPAAQGVGGDVSRGARDQDPARRRGSRARGSLAQPTQIQADTGRARKTLIAQAGSRVRIPPSPLRKGLADIADVGSAVAGNLHATSEREGSAVDARDGVCECCRRTRGVSGMATRRDLCDSGRALLLSGGCRRVGADRARADARSSSKASATAAQHARSLSRECRRRVTARAGVAASLTASVTATAAVTYPAAARVGSVTALNTSRETGRDEQSWTRSDAASQRDACPGKGIRGRAACALPFVAEDR